MIDPEALCRQLGELLISVPDFYKPGPLSPEGHEWRARAYALVKDINPAQGGIRTAEERAILFGQTAASVQAAVR